MKMALKPLWFFVIPLAGAVSASGSGSAGGEIFAAKLIPSVVPSYSVEFRGVEFRAGHPAPNESLLVAVKQPGEVAAQLLEEDMKLLKNLPKVRLKAIGFTDGNECVASECAALSLRRAKYVRDWFLEHGVPKERLDEPEGRGSNEPIDTNETEEGRQRNRRAEVSPVFMP